MKTNKLLLMITSLFLTIGTGGCDDNNDLHWEITPNSKTSIIEQKIDGITFKFCLLNEQGKPAKIFEETKNFSFYFSATNNNKKDLYFDLEFITSNFFKVYNSDNKDMGVSFKLLTTTDIGVAAFPFVSGQKYEFQQFWIDNRTTSWTWLNGAYQSVLKEHLPKGNYYTEFKHRFRFAQKGSEEAVYTDILGFKINFEIR